MSTEKLCLFRIRWQQEGGHIHCRVFTGYNPECTFALSGNLVFREDEWKEARAKLGRLGELIEEPRDER